ncbi:MAG TPA: hypothetical protein PLC52_11010 [Anaerolineales bacterium]|nr:hypothetical protein [Anaerolineales bacterium]HRQ93375.1 hypothetical protein [Anaerolineales bacterium]
MTENDQDAEIKAIASLIEILSPLEKEAQERIIAYVLQRLGLQELGSRTEVRSAIPESAQREVVTTDIRTLKETKKPNSDVQMAVLVGYYLSELAPVKERKSAITKADLEKYFKQAGYRLPSKLRQTLPNAARGGYFEGLGKGNWRLTPVGYNLAAHGLPQIDKS